LDLDDDVPHLNNTLNIPQHNKGNWIIALMYYCVIHSGYFLKLIIQCLVKITRFWLAKSSAVQMAHECKLQPRYAKLVQPLED